MGYSDYYKNNANTPGEDDEEDVIPGAVAKGGTAADAAAKRRKDAIQRRLKMRKAGN
jgi:hypothetical protein